VANKELVKLLKEKGVEAWNEWRKKRPGIRPDLRDAGLRGVNLDEANLCEADLAGAAFVEASLIGANLFKANLQGARLGGANLVLADLQGANLIEADLAEANLEYANLREANLERADLSGVNLTGSDITGANISACRMQGTKLGDLDLSCCSGLDTIDHVRPSTIGIDTIYLSGGNIPEVFLRGAGVPESFITYMKSLVAAMSPVEFYSVFISYSHTDKAFARKLHDTLQSKGIRCWLDEHQLLPGDDIYHEVDRGIRLWDKMLLCCSESSLKSWWVDNEIGTAFDKEQQLMKERETKIQVLVPLNLDGYLFSDKWKSGYQAQVRRRLAADFTESGTGTKFDEQVERLIKALRADEGAREKPPKPRL
jgi:hypothetical protein